MHSLPGYFPVQKHPPIYRTRPHKLEGVFGPSVPKGPEPTHLNFGEEFNVHTDTLPPIRTTPLRRSDNGADDYEQQQQQQPQQQQYQRSQYQFDPSRYRRLDAEEVPQQPQQQQQQQQQHRPDPLVYKTVRDMDYARPKVILHVKDSGELFVPGQDILDPIVQPSNPTSTLINTPLQELRQRRNGQFDVVDQRGTPEGREWLPDFSDQLNSPKVQQETAEDEQSKPKRQIVLPQVQQQQNGSGNKLKFEDANDYGRQQQQQQQQQQGGFSFPEPLTSNVRPFSLQEDVKEAERKDKRKVSSSASSSNGKKPNYKVVIGLRDDGQEEVVKKAANSGPERYTKEELYRLCIKEVPEYLKFELCHHVLDDVKARARYLAKLKEEEEEEKRKKLKDPFKRRPSNPKPKKGSFNPFDGIPKELPKETKKRQPAKVKKVEGTKVYKPDEKTTTTTTTTEATTTAAATAEKAAEAQEKSDRPLRPAPKRPAFNPGVLLQGLTSFFKSRLHAAKKAQEVMDKKSKSGDAFDKVNKKEEESSPTKTRRYQPTIRRWRRE